MKQDLSRPDPGANRTAQDTWDFTNLNKEAEERPHFHLAHIFNTRTEFQGKHYVSN